MNNEVIERSIIKTYRKEIWARFIKGVKEFNMIEDGDKIAVCMSGGTEIIMPLFSSFFVWYIVCLLSHRRAQQQGSAPKV